jgi:S-adenosylmethionine-diacylglycerol 3-amino-3-carboxypropyl transferase
MTTPAWLAAACAWPVAFAQVREDPLVDQAVADRLPADSTLMMIASGGCTAAWLARHPRLREITVVDANPAQLALTRLKRKLLSDADPPTRLAVLGHAAMDPVERRRRLAECFAAADIAADSLGPPSAVAQLGPDYCGRYEQLFAALQAALRFNSDLSCGLGELLALGSAKAQIVWLDHHAGWWQSLADVFNDIFALPTLVALFGDSATQNRVQPFARHFLEQLRQLLTHHSVRDNPFVWQMLCGRYADHARAAWLDLPAGPISAAWRYVQATMIDAMRLAAEQGVRYRMLHLSNVLDWLSPQEALATLRAAWDCTESAGWILVRQLNSNLDIRALGAVLGWQWDTQWGDELLQADRSFFYRMLHVGRKP